MEYKALFDDDVKVEAMALLKPYVAKISAVLIDHGIISKHFEVTLTNDDAGLAVFCALMLVEFKRYNVDAEYCLRKILIELQLDFVNTALNPINDIIYQLKQYLINGTIYQQPKLYLFKDQKDSYKINIDHKIKNQLG